MKYTDDQILAAVADNNSWAAVYRVLTGKAGASSPGMQSHLKRRALKAGADISHFRWLRKPKAPATEPTPEPVAEPVA